MTPNQMHYGKAKAVQCRPSGRPGAGIPSQPRTLPAQSPGAAAYAKPDLDQPTPENRYQPSLNRDVGCLKVIDTFRRLEAPSGVQSRTPDRHAQTDAWQRPGHHASAGPHQGLIGKL